MHEGTKARRENAGGGGPSFLGRFILAMVAPLMLAGCVDSFRTTRPYPGTVHEPGFWRDLSGMEATQAAREAPPATTRRARMVTVTPAPPRPVVIDAPPPPSIDEIPLPRTASLAGLSTRLDDVLRNLDQLVEESIRVQESLMRLRLRGKDDQKKDEEQGEREQVADTAP